MHPLVLTNLSKTLSNLSEGGFPALEEPFASMAVLPGYRRVFREESWTMHPMVYRDAGKLVTPQAPLLGFYCLVTAVRGVLLAVNYILGARNCVAAGLSGPSVTLSYTAAYHALTAYLALEGRVILDASCSPFDECSPHHFAKTPLAVLTRSNQWLLEGMDRSHKSRWHQLYSVYSCDSGRIPTCFHDLFEFTYQGFFMKGLPIVELVQDPKKYQLTLADSAAEFFDGIASIRHRAVYHSLGDDPRVVDALVNRDVFSTEHLARQSHAFFAFAQDLITVSATNLAAFAGSTSLAPEIQSKMSLSVYYPWFDAPIIGDISIQNLRDSLQSIHDWVTPPTLVVIRTPSPSFGCSSRSLGWVASHK
jgi:hypothetical protein